MHPARPTMSPLADALQATPTVTLATLLGGAAMLVASAIMLLTDGQLFAGPFGG